jgi:hypothetical protein
MPTYLLAPLATGRYKPYYDGQAPYFREEEVGERYVWGKMSVGKKKTTVHIETAVAASKKGGKHTYKERFQAKQANTDTSGVAGVHQWTVYPVGEDGIPEHASMASITPSTSKHFTGFGLECFEIRTRTGTDASVAMLVALVVGEL